MCTSSSSASSTDEQVARHAMLADLELLCKNRCGFYGTPQCEGLCSRCWRDFQLESKRHNDYHNNIKVLRQHHQQQHQRHQSEFGVSGTDGGGTTTTTAAATAQQRPPPPSSATRKGSDVRFNYSLKTLLKKSPSVFSASTYATEAPQSPLITFGPRPPSPDSVNAQERLNQFLDANFPPAYAKELDKQCQAFIDNVFKSEFLPSDELSLLVQAFYQSVKESAVKMLSSTQMAAAAPPPNDGDTGVAEGGHVVHPQSHPAVVSLSDIMTEVEDFVCTRTYPVLFGSRTEEEAEDLSLQTRIRSLHWVTNGFLETALDESSGQVQEYLNEAITEIVDLNSHRPVTKKLDCLVRCSKDIFDALRESCSGAPASADEFLPVLILIILRANPPLIQSNLKFISRFGLPSRHMRGEYGYYYTNLSSAIYFIQDMNAASLQISEDEFERYMSGRTVPPPRNSISTSVVRSFENSLHKLDKLKRQEEELNRKADELEVTINSDIASFKERICEFVAHDGGLDEHIRQGIREALSGTTDDDNNDDDPTATSSCAVVGVDAENSNKQNCIADASRVETED